MIGKHLSDGLLGKIGCEENLLRKEDKALFSTRNYPPARLFAGVLLLICSSLVLAGCGGSDDAQSNSSPTTSPFAGSYTGTFIFTQPGNTETGDVTITIASDGTVNGNVTDSSTGQTGPVSGAISNSGSTSGSAAFTVNSGGSTTTSKGTVGFASNGHLKGTLTQFSGSTQIGTTTIDLIKGQQAV